MPPMWHVRRMWVLGPALSLLVMVMANSGFAASQSSVRLAIAGPVATFGLLLAGTAVALAARPDGQTRTLPPQAMTPLIALAPPAAIAGVFWASGPLVLVLLIGSQLAAFAAVAVTLDRGPTQGFATPALAQDAASASLVGLGTILPLLVFQLDYDIPLGFPNELVIIATALVFGAATVARRQPRSHTANLVDGLRTQGSGGRPSLVLLVGAGLVALVGSGLALGRELTTDPQPVVATETAQLTLVSWNLHYGVNPDGGLDLEQIARSIEEQNPSIVTLQEVSRGWVLGAGTDMATWLGQRLDMRVAYAPAADRQFGNVVLTNLATTNITAIALPYGAGPQERSAISIDIALPGGPLRVTSVHLQNKDRIPTRLDQIETLLTAQTDGACPDHCRRLQRPTGITRDQRNGRRRPPQRARRIRRPNRLDRPQHQPRETDRLGIRPRGHLHQHRSTFRRPLLRPPTPGRDLQPPMTPAGSEHATVSSSSVLRRTRSWPQIAHKGVRRWTGRRRCCDLEPQRW